MILKKHFIVTMAPSCTISEIVIYWLNYTYTHIYIPATKGDPINISPLPLNDGSSHGGNKFRYIRNKQSAHIMAVLIGYTRHDLQRE